MNISVNMCRKNAYSVSITVIVACPEVRRSAVVHEVTVTWVYSWTVMSVIRTDLHWLLWRLSVSWLVLTWLLMIRTKIRSHSLTAWLAIYWACYCHWLLWFRRSGCRPADCAG